MGQLTTAGRLLGELAGDGITVRDAVASAAGIRAERADEAMAGDVRLSLSEQLRLAEATALLAPRFARQAVRLRGQVLAARSYEQGSVDRHADSPAERWERSAQMRR